MKAELAYFHCGDQLRKTVAAEIGEVEAVIAAIEWAECFQYTEHSTVYQHQTAYNKAFAAEFNRLGWEPQPVLRIEPKLIGDFRKGLVFVEIQFGNSATLYRDYYKFQYGLTNGLMSLAVLIVPMKAKDFFPTRPLSVQNMAEYSLAHTCLSVLPINVPTLVIGLLAA
jgi:Restriction endonuclease BglII